MGGFLYLRVRGIDDRQFLLVSQSIDSLMLYHTPSLESVSGNAEWVHVVAGNNEDMAEGTTDAW